MQENNRLVQTIHSFYALFKVNFLSMILLVIGAFFFTFQPVLKANLVLVKLIKEGKVDGYSNIRDNYLPIFKGEFKNVKKDLMPILILIWLSALVIILKKINSPIASVLNLFLGYLCIMTILFCLFWQLLNIQLHSIEKEEATILEGFIFMFFNLKNFIYSIILLIAFIFVGYKWPVLILVILLPLYIFIFYCLNLSSVDSFIEIIKRRRND